MYKIYKCIGCTNGITFKYSDEKLNYSSNGDDDNESYV